jgi:fatty-acyl-CoA synthase
MPDETRSLSSLLTSGAAAEPAFVFDGTAVSASEFASRVDETTAWLAAHDIGRDDVIAVWLVNRLEWVALLFAAAKLGAIVAAVNTRYRSADVAHLLRLSGAKLLIVEAAFRAIDFAAILDGIDKDQLPQLACVAVVGAGDFRSQWPLLRFDAFDKAYPPARLPPSDVDAPVLLYTTSGTTKGPKLVAHSQVSLVSHARAIGKALALSPRQHSLLAMLPF